MKKRNLLILGIIFTVVTLISAPVGATSITFTGSSGNLSASALFDLTGNTLTITLTNTSLADVLVPTDVLTGLFFDTNPAHTLTPVSASLNGSTVYYGSLTDVGDGWGYGAGVSAHEENSAISASGAVNGLGHSNFSSNNNALQGLDYGILSAGDNTATDNGGIHGPLIKNSVQFALTAGSGFSLSDLGNNVVFQYGTALTDPNFPNDPTSVPEPSVLLLLGAGLIGLGAFRRRFKK